MPAAPQPPTGTPDPAPGPAARALLALAAFAPAALAAWLVATHAVNVPVWDDWERGRLVEKWQDGTLDFAFLYSPHIDHRILVPRLVALANAAFFGGDLRLEMGLAFAVVLGTALACRALLSRTLGPAPGPLFGATLLVNLLLFTPLQWENLLWAAQPFFLLPMGAFVLALLVLGSGLSLGARFALCLGIALVVSHTFSHGLVIWPLVAAVAVLRRDFGPPRARIAFLAAWGLAAAAVLLPYFTVGGFRSTSFPTHTFGLETGERVPAVALGEVLADPLRAVRFVFAMLGSVTARVPYFTTARAALWAGAAIAALFLAPLVPWLARWRDARAWDRWLPWVLLGGVSLGMCTLAGVGRTAMRGWAYALLPHYVSIAIWVPLAAIALWALAVQALRSGRAPGPAAAVASGVVVAVLLWGWGVGAAGMEEWRSARLQARTSLLFSPHFKPGLRGRLDGSNEVVREMGAVLDRHGQLAPPLLPDRRLARFAIDEAPLDAESGWIDRASGGHGRIALAGHAWLPDADRRVDGVLLVARDAAGEREVIEVIELQGLPRVHIAAHEHAFNHVVLPGAEQFGAFDAEVLVRAFPDGRETEVEAFAVDAARMRVRPFADRLLVRRAGGEATAWVRRARAAEDAE
jgi:hypothetical protein